MFQKNKIGFLAARPESRRRRPRHGWRVGNRSLNAVGESIWRTRAGTAYRGFAIRIFTTGAGGGSLALSSSAALVMALRLLTAAADMSGNLGITETHVLPASNICRLRAENGSDFSNRRFLSNPACNHARNTSFLAGGRICGCLCAVNENAQECRRAQVKSLAPP
jgi:hypothetical protein